MATETKKEVEKAEPEAPLFMATQPVFTGDKLHQPGEKIYWAVPEGWDEEKQGKHYAHAAPSITLKPLNAEAKALHEKCAKEKAARTAAKK